MKITQATAFASLLLAAYTAQAGQPIINLNVGGELAPGVYGQVQFGNAPPPPVLYPQPRIIMRQPRGVAMEPMYLHVPPGHARNWRKHCREYGACDHPVYFVKSREYEAGYAEERRGRGRGHDRHHERERADRRNEDHRGYGTGYEGGRREHDGRDREEHRHHDD